MNKIKNNAFMLLAMSICLAAWSCSNEENPLMPEVPANPDALCAITPGAIEIGYEDASQALLTRSATGQPLQKATYVKNLGHNYSVKATVEAVPQKVQTRAAPAAPAANVQYRIVVFDGSGAVVGNVVYKYGSSSVVSGSAIKLKAGTYRLFCYSINSTASIRDLDTDKKNVSVNTGDDFMTYTVTNFVVATTDYANGKRINISFKRQCAQLDVAIMSKEYSPGYIKTPQITIPGKFSNTKWNGAANTDDSTLPAVTGNLFLTSSDESAHVQLKYNGASFVQTSPQLLDLTFPISIVIDGTQKSANITFSELNLQAGYKYVITIVAMNSYQLTTSNPVTIGGIRWAWTYLGSNTKGPYLRANAWDLSNPDKLGYWSWGMLLPNENEYGKQPDWVLDNSGNDNSDPCKLVSNPGGINWRLPDKRQLEALMNYKAPRGTKVYINNILYNVNNDKGVAESSITGSGFSAPRGAVFISQDQVLYLHAEGFTEQGSNLGNPTNIDYIGGIWARDAESAGGSYAWCLFFGESRDMTVMEMFRSRRQTVRCVEFK